MNFLQMLGIGGLAPQPTGNLPPDLLQGIDTQQPQQVNAIQGINPADVTADAAPLPPQAVPLPRRSILDTIGRISDVLANTGGAQAQYQPTLDARQAHELALGDHSRQVDLDKLKLATEQNALGDAGNARVGQAARGVQAILAANPQADVSKIWPLIAAQTGVPADRIAAVGQTLAQDPSALTGLVTGLNAAHEQGTQPKEIQLYNLLKLKNPALADAYLAKLGNPQAEMTPYQAAQVKIAEGKLNNDTARLGLARDAATAKTGGGSKAAQASSEAADAMGMLDNIEGAFKDLSRMKALPGQGDDFAGNMLGALGRSRLGQAVGEQVGNEAAQKRLELAKNVSLLQQTLIKALPATATRTKFEQEILKQSLPDATKMTLGTAQTVIKQYRDIFRRAQQAAASPAPGTRALPPRLSVRPPASAASSGWGKAIVVNK